MNFAKTLEGLNPKQLEAVKAIDGPVLVIAGPGTGKTQLLSTRVGYILKNTDTQPQNILCLTFTNKAAINMMQRIIELSGAEGSKVLAKTFHSFAAEIMNEYPDYFWNAAKLSTAPDSVQLDIIESIISDLPLDSPLALKFAGQYTLISDIKNALKLVKEAGLTPDKLRALINLNLAYIDEIEPMMVDICSQNLSAKKLHELKTLVDNLPIQQIDEAIYPISSLSTVIIESLDNAIAKDDGTGKSKNTSSWKSRWIQSVNGQKGMHDERRRNNWWLELANVYETYRNRIHARGFYDYADMLVEVISQLEQNPEILSAVQERFNYVMIDEFQDTNPAQMRLAHLVSTHYSDNGNPNIMTVGDDDQSIFKFNGAELNNMLGFTKLYPKAKIIVLTENYRSTQEILDVSKMVMEQASNRLVSIDPSLDKNLVAKAKVQPGDIKAVAYSSRELQLSEIARDIAKKYSPNKEIAVLARGHDSLRQLAGLLQKLEVPVRYEQSSNILDHEIIELVYLICLAVVAINSGDKSSLDATLHHILRSPVWQIEPSELWKLANANFETKTRDWLASMLENPNKNISNIGGWLLELSKIHDQQPLPVTIEQIIGLRSLGEYSSPIKNYYTSTKQGANQYFHALSAIHLLRKLVDEFSDGNKPTLQEFAHFIEINKQNNVVIADESPFITGNHAVQLLTVHKAKGLEFDDVYIIDAVEGSWEPRKGGRKPPANLPLQPVGDDADDYIRLMYVALTRAKSNIIISGYYQDATGRDVAISPIIQSVFDVENVDISSRQMLTQVLEENLSWPSLSGGLEKEMLASRLETYKLNITHLLNFLDVTKGGPQYFKERNLLRLPEIKTINLSFGTAMHDALEYAQKLTNQNKFNLDEVIQKFNHSLEAQQVSAYDYDRYQPVGQRSLETIFKEFGFELNAGAKPEQNIVDVKVSDATIGGKLDTIFVNSGNIEITDYKTGVPLASFDTKDKTKAIKAYRHRMQLIFYALLISESGMWQKDWQLSNITGRMVYVEAEAQKDLIRTYVASQEEIEHLKKLINAVWHKIMNLDFPDTSQYPQDIQGILDFEADLINSNK